MYTFVLRAEICATFEPNILFFQEMERVEKELEATVRQPANAEKYRMEQIAEAKRQKVILEAEAEAEAIRVSGCIFSFIEATCSWYNQTRITGLVQ